MKIRNRLNQLAWQFYQQMGHTAKEGFDFSASRHPQELMCYRMAEIAWEEFMGDRPDYAEEDEDEEIDFVAQSLKGLLGYEQNPFDKPNEEE